MCYLCYYTLTVLWSLVRGKKWNPLRERKDTVRVFWYTYVILYKYFQVILDTRQQFLATSLFVILLFILPTIFVYFVVFRCLRLAVSALQTVLYFFATWPFQLFALEKHLAEKYGKPADAQNEALAEKKTKSQNWIWIYSILISSGFVLIMSFFVVYENKILPIFRWSL